MKLNIWQSSFLVLVILFFLATNSWSAAHKQSVTRISQEISEDVEGLRDGLRLKTLPDLGLAQAKSGAIFSSKFTFKRAMALIPSHQEEVVRENTQSIVRYLLIIYRNQSDAGDGAKLTMEKFIEDYKIFEGLKEYKKSLHITEEHPEYHQNFRMIGAIRSHGEELKVLQWARSNLLTNQKYSPF